MLALFDYVFYSKQPEVYSEYNPDFIRFFPKEYITTASVNICADRIVIFPMPKHKNMQNTTIFNIISQSLADSYRKWFDGLWKNSIPINNMNDGR